MNAPILNSKERREIARAAGQCIGLCGNPPRKGFPTCETCYRLSMYRSEIRRYRNSYENGRTREKKNYVKALLEATEAAYYEYKCDIAGFRNVKRARALYSGSRRQTGASNGPNA